VYEIVVCSEHERADKSAVIGTNIRKAHRETLRYGLELALNEVKHLAAEQERPFAALRVTR
jgi:hypothetical protein